MPPCISSGSYRFLGTLDGKDLPEALSWYHPYRCPVPYLSPHELNLGPLYKDLITKALRILANSLIHLCLLSLFLDSMYLVSFSQLLCLLVLPLCSVLKCLQVQIPHLCYSLNETFPASIGNGLFPSSLLLDCGLLISSKMMYLLVCSIPIHLYHLCWATSPVQDLSPLVVAGHLCSFKCFPLLHATVD